MLKNESRKKKIASRVSLSSQSASLMTCFSSKGLLNLPQSTTNWGPSVPMPETRTSRDAVGQGLGIQQRDTKLKEFIYLTLVSLENNYFSFKELFNLN